MKSPSVPNVSVVQPVESAIQRVKDVLFRPFDFEKWIAIGFCAWLASFGGFGSSWGGGNNSSSGGKSDLSPAFRQSWDYTLQNLIWIIPLVVVLGGIAFAIWMVVLWLSSRGQFMLLHCVAHNRGEVGVPWKKYAREARSLWLFRLMLSLSWLAAILVVVAAGVAFAAGTGGHEPQMNPGLIAFLVVGVLSFICFCVLLLLIGSFTTQFVVPIMYRRGCTSLEGWKVLRGLVAANPGRFLVYLLFQIVLAICIGCLVLLVILCTCCIAGCLMLLPFFGAVVLLPITVFSRSYPLYYLAQYGSEYDVFLQP